MKQHHHEMNTLELLKLSQQYLSRPHVQKALIGSIVFVDEYLSEIVLWNHLTPSLFENGALTVQSLNNETKNWISVKQSYKLLQFKKHEHLGDQLGNQSLHNEDDDDDDDVNWDNEEWDDEEEEEEHHRKKQQQQSTVNNTTPITTPFYHDELQGITDPIRAVFFINVLSPEIENRIKTAIHTYAFTQVVVFTTYSDVFYQYYQNVNENYLTYNDLNEKLTLWVFSGQKLKNTTEYFDESIIEP
jgi:hypothetical protein